MTRPLDDIVAPVPTGAEENEPRVARATARAFAAAVSALLISTLVVSRSGQALDVDGATSGTTATAGTIALVDDDQGRSLFDLADLAPNRPVERCLEVSYDGTILPVDLTVAASAEGGLSPFLDTRIEAGVGGDFDSCEDFVATSEVFDGTLARLDERGAVIVDTFYNTGESRSFRIVIAMADEQDALGLTTTADFIWEVTPS